MRKFILILLLISCSAATELTPYISPGIMLSWNNKNLMTVGFKFSLGLMITNNSYISNPCFTNITLGVRAYPDDNMKDYSYLEIESGIWQELLLGGLGAGIARYKNKDLSPRFSLFFGDIAFIQADCTIYKNRPDLDIGGMLVMPISKYLFNSFDAGLPVGD